MYDQPSSPYRILLIPLAIIFWGAIGVTIFKVNPYLISSTTLRGELTQNKVENEQPIPSPEFRENRDNLGTQNPISASNQIAPNKQRWSRKLALSKIKPVTPPKLDNPQLLPYDKQLFIWSPTSPLVYSQNLDKDDENPDGREWSFEFSKEEYPVGPPTITESLVILASNRGTLITLQRNGGTLIWSNRVRLPIQESPTVVDSKIYLPLDDSGSVTTLIKIFDIETGDASKKSITIPGRLSAPITYLKEKDLLLISTDQRELHAITQESLETKWKHTSPSPVTTKPSADETHIYINTADQNAYAISSENAEIKWEYKLKGVAATPFLHVPNSPFISVLTQSGYLHTINKKRGSGVWRFNTQSKASTHNLTAIRLNNQVIEERELKWRYKGWVLWAPCVENRICMFNPEEGNLIGRLSTTGELASMPFFPSDKREFTLLLKNVKDTITKKVHKWGIGHYIELAQLKRQLKEKAVAAAQAKNEKLKKEMKKKADKKKKITNTPAPKTQKKIQESPST